MSGKNVRPASSFKWTEKTEAAALALAQGKTQLEVAAEIGVADRTLRRWLADEDFKDEVDRLSLMIDFASRAGRLRLAQRVIRQKIAEDGEVETEKDLLDWLKFLQSETDGVKLELTKALAALTEDAPPVAAKGSD